MSKRELVTDLLRSANVVIGGSAPGDITVHDEHWYARILDGGSLALGESYMDGWWDCQHLDVFFHRILLAKLDVKVRGNFLLMLKLLPSKIFNRQTFTQAFRNSQYHYDIGNELYSAMLDKRLVYTSAYDWRENATLDSAQEAKLDLVCHKLDLQPGMKVLDIGCGWGSFAKFAAERYGVEVVGVTLSKEQVGLGSELCKGLPIDIQLMDYREVTGSFDRVVSLGMIEHVGSKNYRTYMHAVANRLKDNGLFLLQTIGSNISNKMNDPWIDAHIFPGSTLPSIQQIGNAIEGSFVMEDWHNFGADYDMTLMAWNANFEASWPGLEARYGERFHRMWRYYLLSCAGAFRARTIHVWQIVLSKTGVAGGYQSIR